MRISSYVPNLASSKGWMALAAVYLGKKKIVKMVIFLLIFSLADFFAANIQNYTSAFTSEAFAGFIEKNGIEEFYITGADATACVKSTSYNLVKRI